MKMKKTLIAFIMIFCVVYSIFLPSTQVNEIEAKDYYFSTSRIDQYSQTFIDASLEFGVPASVLMAMAIEETSFGTAGVGVSLNNWFGMEKSSLYPTDPSYTGRFEKYPDAKASIRDAARLMGSPKASYKVTNIIINRGSLDASYEAIVQSITAHWCVNEPGAPCSYDGQTLLDDIDKYGLKKYDSALAALTMDELKAILDKYYGPNAIPIPGYDEAETGWDGNYTDPDLSENQYNSIYFNTEYSGDITQGYIYKKYSEEEMWDDWGVDSDEQIVDVITRNIFLQGEKLYGDGTLHISDFLFNGTDDEAPSTGVIGNGSPLACYTAITSSFNDQESFRKAKHKGLDLAAPRGTEIYSVTDGIVIGTYGSCPATGYYGSSCGGGYGNHVKVKAPDGTVYIYAHMNSTPSVSVNNAILKGQLLGVVGSSGSSTGPHLHFEVKVNGTSVNPLPYANVDQMSKCS